MRGFGGIIAAIVALTAVATAKEDAQDFKRHYLHIYGVAQHYEWHEYQGDETLLMESGPLYGVELSGGYTDNNHKWFRYRAQIFSGDVDYDGALQNGTPYQTTTEYLGLEATIDGDLISLANSGDGDVLNLYLGLGYRGWERDLTGPNGYIEKWQTFFISTGLWGRYQLSESGRSALRGKLELRLPFYNHEHIDLSRQGGPSITLHPGWAPSLYGSFGGDVSFLSAELFIQTLYFTESDDYFGFYQPESLGVLAGVKAGLAF